jgi:hypothetical protein
MGISKALWQCRTSRNLKLQARKLHNLRLHFNNIRRVKAKGQLCQKFHFQCREYRKHKSHHRNRNHHLSKVNSHSPRPNHHFHSRNLI